MSISINVEYSGIVSTRDFPYFIHMKISDVTNIFHVPRHQAIQLPLNANHLYRTIFIQTPWRIFA